MRFRHLPIPSGVALSVVQFYPTPSVTFIMDAYERQIRRFAGRGIDGEYRKYTIKLPPISYTFKASAPNSMWMYVLKEFSENEISGKEVRIGNVHGSGKICWGTMNEIPQDPRGKMYMFWDAPFNDDLTPYPEFIHYEAWVATPEAIRLIPDMSKKVQRISRLCDFYSGSWAEIINVAQSYCEKITGIEKIRKRIDYYDSILGYHDIHGSLNWRIMHEEDEVKRKMLVEKKEMYTTLRRMASELADRKEYTVRNIMGNATALRENIATYCTYIYRNARSERRSIKNKFAGIIFSLRDRMKSLMESIKDDQIALEMKNAVVRAFREQAYSNIAFYLREIGKVEYRKAQKAFNERCGKEWWENGGWQMYGDTVKLKDMIFGSEYVSHEEQFSGVVLVSFNSAHLIEEEKLRKAVVNLFGRHRQAQIFLPVWRLPDNKVVGEVGGVVYTGTLESSGEYVNLRMYSEEDERMDSIAKEVFG